MKREEYVRANREAWNEAQGVHAVSRDYDIVADIRAGRLHVDMNLIDGIVVKDKVIGQFCCNNGREALSLVALGARECVGFDISDSFIEEAREMTEKLGYNCSFIRTDVSEIETHENYFDLVLFTAGALPWLQDMGLVFKKVSYVLKPGGTVIVSDWHPFMGMFAMPGETDYDPANPDKIAYSYFRKEPVIEDNGMDYVGGTTYKSKKFYSFSHTFAEILNALADNGISLARFDESPDDVIGSLGHFNGKGVPLSFRIVAIKKK
jgi:ubiquinone/menaquinone biosynthesis C-methylase UbiE